MTCISSGQRVGPMPKRMADQKTAPHSFGPPSAQPKTPVEPAAAESAGQPHTPAPPSTAAAMKTPPPPTFTASVAIPPPPPQADFAQQPPPPTGPPAGYAPAVVAPAARREAKAQAAAAKAYAKAQRSWYQMKRWWAAGLLLLAVVGYANSATSPDDGQLAGSNQATPSQSVEPAAEQPASAKPPVQESAAEEGPTFENGVLTTSELKVQITRYQVIKPGQKGNAHGKKPVIAFWYEATNLSGDRIDPNIAFILNFKAYQDNNPNAVNELDVGSLPDDRFLDSQSENIKKGGTVENATAYELDDLVTPVKLVAIEGLDDVIGKATYTLGSNGAVEIEQSPAAARTSQAAPTSKSLVAQFKEAGIPIGKTRFWNAKTDQNDLLGRPGQYHAKVSWFDGRVEDGLGDFDVSDGGSLEMFKSESAAKRRYRYLKGITSSSPLFAEYSYLHGTVLLRLATELTPSQAKEYEGVVTSALR